MNIYKKTIVFFIGGASDKKSFYGHPPTFITKNEIVDPFYETCIKPNNLDSFYIAKYLGYNEVCTNFHIDNIMKSIPDKKVPIHIIGHSLGGWNGAHLSKKLSDEGYKIHLLITLDPVGMLGAKFACKIFKNLPEPKADYWINILTKPKKYAFDDLIADLGGQWNPNISTTQKKPDIFYISKNNHKNAGDIFKEKIKDDLSANDFLLNSIKKNHADFFSFYSF